MKLNIVQVAGILWLFMGCGGFYFASKKVIRDSDLRSNGVHVVATVIGEQRAFRVKNMSTTSVTNISEQDDQRSQSGRSPGTTAEVSYQLNYEFEVAGKGKIAGHAESDFPFNKHSGSKVDVVYLPSNSRINDLRERVVVTKGYILFWSVGSLFFLVFFGIPGFGLVYLGREKKLV